MVAASQYSFADGSWIGGTPYRVVRALGAGGMGEVYEVDHTRTGTRRAVKIVTSRADAGGQAQPRLVAEGKALRRIDHPNVVRVYEVGTIQDGRAYFAMELLEGLTVRAVMRSTGPIPHDEAIAMIVQTLDGLEAVHGSGIVHRDIKPANLFLCRGGRLKVLDFGVAKITSASFTCVRTGLGMVPGTVRYMAPEQLLGSKIGAFTDIYAAGLVLYEMISGRHPFHPGGHTLSQSAPRLSSRCARSLPVFLDEIVARSLELHPSRRFQSAREFSSALRAVTCDTGLSTGPTRPDLARCAAGTMGIA